MYRNSPYSTPKHEVPQSQSADSLKSAVGGVSSKVHRKGDFRPSALNVILFMAFFGFQTAAANPDLKVRWMSSPVLSDTPVAESIVVGRTTTIQCAYHKHGIKRT